MLAWSYRNDINRRIRTGPSIGALFLCLVRVVERPEDPFATLDLAVLGSTHIVSGLSCRGRVTSDVVGSGWTQVTFCVLLELAVRVLRR